MTLIELEELLSEALDGIAPNFVVSTNDDGEIIIFTSLGIGDDDELFELEGDDDFMDDDNFDQLEEESVDDEE